MPHHKSTMKRLRQSEVRRQRNVHFRSKMRSAVKRVREAIDGDDAAAAETHLKDAVKVIDQNRSKGVIPAKTAARTISRLTKAVQSKSD